MCLMIYTFLRKYCGSSFGNDSFKIIIRIIACLIMISHIYIFNFICYDALPDHSKVAYLWISWITVIMFFLSYYRAWATPPKEILSPENFPEDQYCEKCNSWKPMRAHHCRASNQCVCRMDHYWPWLGNSVGYHNAKYFILLLFYTEWEIILHIDTTIRFSFISGKPSSLFFLTRIFYWFSNI